MKKLYTFLIFSTFCLISSLPLLSKRAPEIITFKTVDGEQATFNKNQKIVDTATTSYDHVITICSEKPLNPENIIVNPENIDPQYKTSDYQYIGSYKKFESRKCPGQFCTKDMVTYTYYVFGILD